MEHVSSKPIVLVLDPSPEAAAAMVERLAERGFEVSFVTSGQEACFTLERSPYDVVLMSLNSENRSLAREIRNQEGLGCRPEIILLSSETEPALYEWHQVGCGAIVPPLDMEALGDCVERLSGRLGKRRYDGDQLCLKYWSQTQSLVSAPGLTASPQDVKLDNASIGRGGFAYEISKPLETPKVGDLVQFEVSLPMLAGHSFSGQGIVRWVRHGEQSVGVGIEFVSIPHESELLILDFTDLFKVQPYVPRPEGLCYLDPPQGL